MFVGNKNHGATRLPPPKFNSSPLKSSLGFNRKPDCLPVPPSFVRGELAVKLGDFNLRIVGVHDLAGGCRFVQRSHDYWSWDLVRCGCRIGKVELSWKWGETNCDSNTLIFLGPRKGPPQHGGVSKLGRACKNALDSYYQSPFPIQFLNFLTHQKRLLYLMTFFQ